MRSFLVRAAAVAAVFVPVAVGAQASSCTPILADACRKSQDMYAYIFPQLGSALAGGHPILGSNAPLGGLGHFSVGLRASGVFGSIPELEGVEASPGAPVNSNISTSDQFIPAPALDAAIGVYGGFPVGVTRVGAVDALVSFAYIPTPRDDESDFELPDGNTRFGFGARVGVVEESIVIPGVSLAYLRRPLPAVSVQTTSEDGTTYGVESLEIDVGSWRLMASKSFLAFDLTAGFGGDNYESSGFILASNPQFSNTTERVGLDQDVTRNVWFIALTLHGGPIHFGLEFGGVSGGSSSTFNTFDPKVNSGRNFVSAGLRVGL